MRLPPFRLERYFAPREFSARWVLCASDCEAWTVEDLLGLEDGAQDALLRAGLGYTETAGAPRLRAAIAETYRGLEADDVLVCAGGEEVIFLFMNAVLDPGDHVVVHTPGYQSLGEIPRAMGCEVSEWRALHERGWRLDLSQLDELLRPETRAIVVNLPHSPTGFSMSPEEWNEFVALVAEREIVLFCDEAYRGLEYTDAARLPAACEVLEHAVSLGLLSKGYGLPGLRIGWAATKDRGLLERMAQLKDFTTICSAAPSELLGELAVRHRETLFARARDQIASNLELARAFFARHTERFAWHPPVAGPVTFPRWLDGRVTVDRMCDEVLESRGVLLLPGTVFDPESRELRLGLGRADFAAALERFDDYLEESPRP